MFVDDTASIEENAQNMDDYNQYTSLLTKHEQTVEMRLLTPIKPDENTISLIDVSPKDSSERDKMKSLFTPDELLRAQRLKEQYKTSTLPLDTKMKDFLIIFNDESKKELGDYIVQLDRMWAKTIENCLDIMDRITFLPPTVFSALQKLQTMREEQKKAELEAKRTEQKLRIVCEEKRQLRDRIANILDQEVPSLDALRYATASFFKRLWDISNERDKLWRLEVLMQNLDEYNNEIRNLQIPSFTAEPEKQLPKEFQTPRWLPYHKGQIDSSLFVLNWDLLTPDVQSFVKDAASSRYIDIITQVPGEGKTCRLLGLAHEMFVILVTCGQGNTSQTISDGAYEQLERNLTNLNEFDAAATGAKEVRIFFLARFAHLLLCLRNRDGMSTIDFMKLQLNGNAGVIKKIYYDVRAALLPSNLDVVTMLLSDVIHAIQDIIGAKRIALCIDGMNVAEASTHRKYMSFYGRECTLMELLIENSITCARSSIDYLAFTGTNFSVKLVDPSIYALGKHKQIHTIRRSEAFPSLYLTTEKEVLDFIALHIKLPEDCEEAIKQPGVIQKLYGRRCIAANFIQSFVGELTKNRDVVEYPRLLKECVEKEYNLMVQGLCKRIYVKAMSGRAESIKKTIEQILICAATMKSYSLRVGPEFLDYGIARTCIESTIARVPIFATPKRDCIENSEKIRKAKQLISTSYVVEKIYEPCAIETCYKLAKVFNIDRNSLISRYALNFLRKTAFGVEGSLEKGKIFKWLCCTCMCKQEFQMKRLSDLPFFEGMQFKQPEAQVLWKLKPIYGSPEALFQTNTTGYFEQLLKAKQDNDYDMLMDLCDYVVTPDKDMHADAMIVHLVGNKDEYRLVLQSWSFKFKQSVNERTSIYSTAPDLFYVDSYKKSELRDSPKAKEVRKLIEDLGVESVIRVHIHANHNIYHAGYDDILRDWFGEDPKTKKITNQYMHNLDVEHIEKLIGEENANLVHTILNSLVAPKK